MKKILFKNYLFSVLISLLSLLSCQSDFEDEVNQPNTNNVRFEKVSLKKTNCPFFI